MQGDLGIGHMEFPIGRTVRRVVDEKLGQAERSASDSKCVFASETRESNDA